MFMHATICIAYILRPLFYIPIPFSTDAPTMNNVLLYYESASTSPPLVAHEGSMARRCFRRLELLIGVGPFRVHYPLDADVPQLHVSRPGMLATVGHLLVFFASTVVSILSQQVYASPNGNEMYDFAADVLYILHFVNVFYLISLVSAS